MFSRLNVVMKIKSLSVLSVAVLAAFFALGASSAQEPTRLLRYPDVFGGDVVFCYGGDLWKASLDGGQARRLTAHPGQELFPKFSPDGKWIAFTSQYDGDEQVYVIPAEGGEPRRLTWYPTPIPRAPRHGYDCQVMGWTPDSKSVMFRSARQSNGVDSLTRLYLVSLDGGLPEALPIPSAGAGDMALDGRYIVYSPPVPRFPQLEAVRRGLGAVSVDLRPKYGQLPADPDDAADRP